MGVSTRRLSPVPFDVLEIYQSIMQCKCCSPATRSSTSPPPPLAEAQMLRHLFISSQYPSSQPFHINRNNELQL